VVVIWCGCEEGMRNAVVLEGDEVAMVAASRNRSVGKLKVVMMLLLFYLGRSICLFLL